MATVRPFRALRPTPAEAERIAAVPYDVVSTDEARALAGGNRLSFLHVSRAEIDLPPGTDVYGDEVYRQAAANFAALKPALIIEDEPSVYLYRLRVGGHQQTGLAGCYSLDEYDRHVIRKHERTRRDKEDDRTRHMLALGAQTGPVLLTYRANVDIDGATRRLTREEPIVDFAAADGVRHMVWRVGGPDRDALVALVRDVPALYIADGHHRAASAARARVEIDRQRPAPGASTGDAAHSTFLGVAFPDTEMRILPYNRVVKDLGGLAPADFLGALRDRFEVEPGSSPLPDRGRVAMYFQGVWRWLRPRTVPDPSDAVGSLDVSVLQDQVLSPVLGIEDVRTDKRIDFVGGRGTGELQALVDSGRAAVAFSLHPVSVDDLMRVADTGAMMPPKSTWFEPKLRDGLLIHVI